MMTQGRKKNAAANIKECWQNKCRFYTSSFSATLRP